MIARLLRDLRELRRCDAGLRAVHVLVLENPSGPVADAAALRRSQERIAGRALTLQWHAPQRDEAWRGPARLPIALARTQLQRACAHHCSALDEPVYVWILDEDLRLAPLLANAGPLGLVSQQAARAQTARIDVLVSPILGAAPLPARSTVRVHLADVLRHLEHLLTLEADSPWPDRREENRRVRSAFAEYYYDFSCAHADAASQAMWLEPAHPGESSRSVYLRLCQAVSGLMEGQPITRAIHYDPAVPPAPLNRGGNTLVLRPALLRDTPNPAVWIGGRVVRRSDMLWARLVQHQRQARIGAGALLAVQDRGGPAGADFSLAKLVDDVRGSALVKAVDAWVAAQREQAEPASALARAEEVYGQHRAQRLRTIQRSEDEVRAQLAASTGLLTRALTGPRAWLAGDEVCRRATHAALAGLEALRVAYAQQIDELAPTAQEATERGDVRAFLSSLPRSGGADRAGAPA